MHIEKVYFHLTGCPEGLEYREYVALPWYKKIFRRNPLDTYIDFFRA